MKRLLPILLLILFCLAACVTPEPVTPPLGSGSDTPTLLHESVDSATTEIKKTQDPLKSIDKAADDVGSKAEEIERLSDDPKIRGLAADIQHLSASISEQIVMISHAFDHIAVNIKKIGKAISSVEALKSALDKEKQQNDAQRAESMKNLYRWIVFFWIAGFGLMVAGGVCMIWFRRIGATLLGIGLLIVAFASAANYYFQQIAVVGLIVIIGGVLMVLGVLAYSIIESQRKEKAAKENTLVVEAVKGALPEDKKIEIFGEGGLADRIQSPTTKKIVSQIRGKIKADAEKELDNGKGK